VTTETMTATALAEQMESWRPTFELAAREVFEMMLGGSLDASDTAQLEEGSKVTAFVGIGGDLRGLVTIVCSSQAALTMASAMLGVPPEDVGDQAWDAIGEICNMVAGNFKGKIGDVAPHCLLSLPTVVSGADYQLRVVGHSEVIELQFAFKTHLLRMFLEVHRSS
jgi:chemotaxis protein CheX